MSRSAEKGSYSHKSLKDVSNSMTLVFSCSASCDNSVSQLSFIFWLSKAGILISLTFELPLLTLPWQSKAILAHYWHPGPFWLLGWVCSLRTGPHHPAHSPYHSFAIRPALQRTGFASFRICFSGLTWKSSSLSALNLTKGSNVRSVHLLGDRSSL